MRSTRSIEILCLALAALVLLWSGGLAAHPWVAGLLLGAFLAAILTFRTRLFRGRTRARLMVESWTMMAFIAVAMWLSGRVESPLFNLFLLPITFSAFTLGRVVTLLQVAAVTLCHLLLAALTPGVEIASLSYAASGVGQVAPILLIGYLTSTLSADITEARERIENLAHTDPLTGLLNQRTFGEVWKREHQAAERGRATYALLMIDMDRLKDINDSFGHEAGNSAITLVARCLQRSIRTSDHAARFSGDEFAVLLPGASPDIAEAVVKRVRNAVYKTTLDLRSRMIRCSVSIGVVIYPKDGRDMAELQSIAERKMYRDKELRRAPEAEGQSLKSRVQGPERTGLS